MAVPADVTVGVDHAFKHGGKENQLVRFAVPREVVGMGEVRVTCVPAFLLR